MFSQTLPRRELLFPTHFVSAVQKKKEKDKKTEVKGRVTWVKAECACVGRSGGRGNTLSPEPNLDFQGTMCVSSKRSQRGMMYYSWVLKGKNGFGPNSLYEG